MATALALLAGEVAVRLLDRAPEVRPIWVSSQDSVYRRSTNPLLSYELVPDYRSDDPDLIRSFERTNAHGQRDLERRLAKPPGVRRVILLGDSVVEGAGVGEQDTMSRQLERLYPDGRTEVLNFGVSGYCTLAEVELLEVKGLAFAPDVVVLVFVENDYLNFNREGFALAAIERPTWAKQLFLGSHLFRLLAVEANLFYFGTEADPAAVNRRATGDNNVVVGLRRLSELARAHGFAPLIAIWPGFPDDAVTDSHPLPGGGGELVVERLARMVGIPAVRLSDHFRHAWREAGADRSPRRLFTIGDELHPSAAGNRVAAAALRDILGGLDAHQVAAAGADPEAIAAAEALGRRQAPDYAEVLNRLGNEALEGQRLAEALRYFRMALVEDPDHADAHNGLGVVYRSRSELAAARDEFAQAVRLAPGFFEARYNLAVTLEQLGDLRAAADHYERVLAERPDLTQVRQRLAELRQRLR